MTKLLITRRELLNAGLAAGVVALVPSTGFSTTIPASDMKTIGPGALATSPYNPTNTGKLSDSDSQLLSDFSSWAIKAWQFSDMAGYTALLSVVVSVKTEQQPSYLAEYQNAAQLINETKGRLGADDKAFLYLMFANRDSDNPTTTRLGRAQKFVFDEIITHIVANGGFRRFGFVNYKGFVSVPFTDPKSYRRTSS